MSICIHQLILFRAFYPKVAREAYFTAALFGLSAKHLSGREKKRNFKAAKSSVDYSTHYFFNYMSWICGIVSDADAEGETAYELQISVVTGN